MAGIWPTSVILNGSFTRLLDPDATLKAKITEFVDKGDFGLAAGAKSDGTYDRVWFEQSVSPDEIMFDGSVFLLTKAKARELKTAAASPPATGQESVTVPTVTTPEEEEKPAAEDAIKPSTKVLRITGNVPPEVWNRVGTKLIPKLKSGQDFKVEVGFSVTVDSGNALHLKTEVQQILQDLGLAEQLTLELEP
jgi:hypothetical protein